MLLRNNKLLTLHEKQGLVYRDNHRFKVVVAGRRWGKSEYSKVEIIKSLRVPNQYVWYVAPSYNMARTIMWRKLKDAVPREWIKKTNDTLMSMLLVNNSLVELKGSDKKDSLRGVGLNKVVVDEAQDNDDEVWYKVLRPTLSDKLGSAVIIGSPRQFNWLYDVYMLGQRGEHYQSGDKVYKNQWASWQFPTITSPYVPESEIEQAKRDMDWKSFSQEYEACHVYTTEVVTIDGIIKQMQDVLVGDELWHVDDSGALVPCKVLHVGPTGQKQILDVKLETGEVITASNEHHFKSGIKKIKLNKLVSADKYPFYYEPISNDEKCAAIVAYNTGDGTICSNKQKYVKKSGEISYYTSYNGAFYSNERNDLEQINRHLHALQIKIKNICIKKNQSSTLPHYQLQISKNDCKKLISLETPVGKKTEKEFCVPTWIMDSSLSVKRAYVAALFGAEGTTPCLSNNNARRILRPIVLSMTKNNGQVADLYFQQIQLILKEHGVESSFSKRNVQNSKNYSVVYYIRITGRKNIYVFLKNIGYLYCKKKQIVAWQWLQYYEAYLEKAKQRKKAIEEQSSGRLTTKEASSIIGVSENNLYALKKSNENGSVIRAGNDFEAFDIWIKNRWNDKLGCLSLKVIEQIERGVQPTMNLLVDSSDHSYLLASGINNYNSFLGMSGRVYYAFDRNTHIRSCNFNPFLPIWVGQDFNIDPMSSVILQPQANGDVHIVDEIMLPNSNSEETSQEIQRRYWRYMDNITLYPDPSGGNRQHAKGESSLQIMRENGLKMQKYRRKAPFVQDRINAVNRMFRSADGTVRMYVDPKCKNLIKGLEQLIYKEGSPDVDKSQGFDHMPDALGYPIELEFSLRKVSTMGLSI